MRKRGWIRILEATIAVLIVSASMIVVYSQHPTSSQDTEDYIYGLQREVLSDIGIDRDLRLKVLRVKEETSDDSNYVDLNNFVNDSLPEGFGYLLRVCELNSSDACKMNTASYVYTMEYDIFVEDIVVFAELGDGSGEVFSPKKVRLFFWEGGFSEDYCMDDCPSEGVIPVCSKDGLKVLERVCSDFDGDGCLEYDGTSTEKENCEDDGKVCENAECVEDMEEFGVPTENGEELNCQKPVVAITGCVYNYDDECSSYDGGQKTGSCGWFKESYECWNFEYYDTDCETSPSCDDGYIEIGSSAC
jgi:hypothetical protein